VGWSEPSRDHDASLQSLRVLALSVSERPDELTRTAFLLITGDNRALQGYAPGL
jgi:hypothetical protein